MDDSTGRQIESPAQQLGQGFIGHFSRAVGVYKNGNRVGHADGISQLHLNLFRQTGCNYIFGHIPCHVSGAAVHLCGILS